MQNVPRLINRMKSEKEEAKCDKAFSGTKKKIKIESIHSFHPFVPFFLFNRLSPELARSIIWTIQNYEMPHPWHFSFLPSRFSLKRTKFLIFHRNNKKFLTAESFLSFQFNSIQLRDRCRLSQIASR